MRAIHIGEPEEGLGSEVEDRVDERREDGQRSARDGGVYLGDGEELSRDGVSSETAAWRESTYHVDGDRCVEQELRVSHSIARDAARRGSGKRVGYTRVVRRIRVDLDDERGETLVSMESMASHFDGRSGNLNKRPLLTRNNTRF
jgi:hypothetical protein